MSKGLYIPLEKRGVITVSGPDRVAFLQGVVSNDIERCARGEAVWTAFLTPQGKYLHDFFVVQVGETLLLECEGDRLMDLGQRLQRYKLRSDVTLDIGRDYRVFALCDLPDGGFEGGRIDLEGGVAFPDPRLPGLGWRLVASEAEARGWLADKGLTAASADHYDRLRLDLGVPDGSRDLDVEKAVLLENGFDELGGIDWQKGCYMGQELTARTRYRGLVKKRLLPVSAQAGDIAPDMPLLADGKEIGQVKSANGAKGLALVRLGKWRQAQADDVSLTVADVPVSIGVPDWVRLPEDE